MGCGDDGPEDADEGAASESLDSEDLESPDAYDCLLPADTITGITGFDFTGVEPDGGAFGGSHGSLAWSGCEYETDDQATVKVAIIVDAEGEPDVASYDAFAAGAASETEPGAEIGAGSFVDPFDQLWVKTADATLFFQLINSDEDEVPTDDLTAIAAAVLDAPGAEDDCAGLPAQVPLEYPASSTTSGGTSSDGTTTFATCRFEVIAGGGVHWDLEVGHVGDPAVFDRMRAEREDMRGGDPTLVEGVADSAVRYRDALYFKAGDTAYTVSGEDELGSPIELSVLEEIAAAVVDAG